MKHIKKIMALALVIVSILAIAVPAMAATTLYGSCSTDEYISVRSSASSSASRIYKLRNGEPVTYTGTSSNGYKKISSPVSGWVDSSYLSSSSPAWKTRYGSKTMNLATYTQMSAFQTDLNAVAGVTDITVDGYWGPETQGAVEQLQAIAGLTVDGIAGTYTKLWTYNLSH
jgi:murein L,D-transpeptidase YcbB/YkuD